MRGRKKGNNVRSPAKKGIETTREFEEIQTIPESSIKYKPRIDNLEAPIPVEEPSEDAVLSNPPPTRKLKPIKKSLANSSFLKKRQSDIPGPAKKSATDLSSKSKEIERSSNSRRIPTSTRLNGATERRSGPLKAEDAEASSSKFNMDLNTAQHVVGQHVGSHYQIQSIVFCNQEKNQASLKPGEGEDEKQEKNNITQEALAANIKQETFLFIGERTLHNIGDYNAQKLRLTPDTYCFGNILDNNKEGVVACIDKTLLIKELVTKGKSRFVFLRPRRWGKSYNDNIIKEFFDVQGAKSLFAGSLIRQDIEFCEGYQNGYFVTFFDFKDFSPNSYRECLANLSSMIESIYERIEESFGAQMNPHQRQKCTKYRNIFLDEDSDLNIEKKLVQSLKDMGKLVSACSQKQVILIVDEYDTPIFSAYCKEDNHEEKDDHLDEKVPLYKKIANLLRLVFSPFSKGGEAFNIKYVVITGILHITREMFLSGASAIEFSPLRSEMSDYFGFTKKEVNTLLEFFKLNQDERIEEEVREWYGNYYMGFGEQHKVLYNPYALINLLSDYKNHGQLNFRAYWKSTSPSDIHTKFLEKLKKQPDEYEKFISYFKALFDNKPVQVTIKTHISFDELQKCEQNADQLINFFYLTGFLTHLPYQGGYNSEFAIEELTECHHVWVMIPNRDALSACQSILRYHMPDYNFSPVFRKRSSIVADYAEFSNIVVGRNKKEKEIIQMLSFLFFSYEHIYDLQFNPLRKSQEVTHSDNVGRRGGDEKKQQHTFFLEEKQLYHLALSPTEPVGSLPDRTIFLYKKGEEFYAKVTDDTGLTETLPIYQMEGFEEHKVDEFSWLEAKDNSEVLEDRVINFIHWLAPKMSKKIKVSGWFLQAKDPSGRPVYWDLEEKNEFSRLLSYLTNHRGYDKKVIYDLVFAGLGYFLISPSLIDTLLAERRFQELSSAYKQYIRRCAITYSEDFLRIHAEHLLSFKHDSSTIEICTSSALTVFPFYEDLVDTYDPSRKHFYYIHAYINYIKKFDFTLSDSLYQLFLRVITYEIYINANMNNAQSHIDYLLRRMKEKQTSCTYLESKKVELACLNVILLFYDYSDKTESTLHTLAKQVLNDNELNILNLNQDNNPQTPKDYADLQKELPEKEHILHRTRIFYWLGRLYYREEQYRKAQKCFDQAVLCREEIQRWLASFKIFISFHRPTQGEIKKSEIYLYKENENAHYSLLDNKGCLEEGTLEAILIKDEKENDLSILVNQFLSSAQENVVYQMDEVNRKKCLDLFALPLNKRSYAFYKMITDMVIDENESYPVQCMPSDENQEALTQGIYIFKKENVLSALVVHTPEDREEFNLKNIPEAAYYIKEKKISSFLEETKEEAKIDFFVEEENKPFLRTSIKSACRNLRAGENKAKINKLKALVEEIKQKTCLSTFYSHACLEILKFQLRYTPEAIELEEINQSRIATLSSYSMHHPEYAEWLYVVSSYAFMRDEGASSIKSYQLEIKKEEANYLFNVENNIRDMLAIYRASFRETHPKILLVKQLQANFFHKKGQSNKALNLYTEIVKGHKKEGMAENKVGSIYNDIKNQVAVELSMESPGILRAWKLPRENIDFIPRPYAINELAKKLAVMDSSEQVTRVVRLTSAVSGMGGVGKTELARYYVHHSGHDKKTPLNQDYPGGRFWFDASSPSQLSSDFRQLGHALKVVDRKDSDIEVRRRVHTWLQLNPGWLAVFDNADSFRAIEEWIPAKGGAVLVTTRENRVGELSNEQIIQLATLEEQEAGQLFYQLSHRDSSSLSEEEKSAVIELVKHLGYLPLAIAQAAAYLRVHGDVLISDYLRDVVETTTFLKENRGDDIFPEVDALSHRIITRTWQISLKAIEAANYKQGKVISIPQSLLALSAYLAPVPIPISILEHWLIKESSDLLINETSGSHALYNYLSILLRYSFIERDYDENTVSVHPLVREVVQREDKTMLASEEEVFKHRLRPLAQMLNDLFPVTNKTEDLEMARLLSPHCIAVADHLSPFLMNFVFLNKNSENTADYYQMKLFHHIGRFHFNIGDARKAGEYHEKALTLALKVYPTMHPDMAIPYNNLGTAYAELGNYEKMRDCLEHALKIQETYYGKDHIAIIATLNNLGNAYGSLGNYTEQRDLLERAWKIQEAYDGKDPIEIAKTLNNLGNAYGALRQHTKRRDLLERAWKIQEAYYGKDHVEVAKTLVNLGTAYGALGDHAKMQDYLERALEIQKNFYGIDHAEVAKTLHNLGTVYGNLGDYAKMRDCLEQALTIQENYYGKDHVAITATLNNLGNVHGSLGNYEKMRDHLGRALEIQEKYYGPDHIEVARTLHNLGMAYGDLGDYVKMRDYLERALQIQEAFYGASHGEIARTVNNLSKAYGKLGDYAKMRDYKEEVEDGQQKNQALIEQGQQLIAIPSECTLIGRGAVINAEVNITQVFMGAEIAGASALEVLEMLRDDKVREFFEKQSTLAATRISPEASVDKSVSVNQKAQRFKWVSDELKESTEQLNVVNADLARVRGPLPDIVLLPNFRNEMALVSSKEKGYGFDLTRPDAKTIQIKTKEENIQDRPGPLARQLKALERLFKENLTSSGISIEKDVTIDQDEDGMILTIHANDSMVIDRIASLLRRAGSLPEHYVAAKSHTGFFRWVDKAAKPALPLPEAAEAKAEEDAEVISCGIQ
jgi:tetratricopeptide (TPR) repeat protein